MKHGLHMDPKQAKELALFSSISMKLTRKSNSELIAIERCDRKIKSNGTENKKVLNSSSCYESFTKEIY